ncbi:MAG: hypothetical protein RQ760_10485, partial [Sedimentisphaerales bacterium]|nr:hypothetical protein [Sedimentisphaerales bacterium]
TQFQRTKMKALAPNMNLTTILIVILADLTTPKGANSNPIAKYCKTALWRIMFLLLFFVNIGCGYADKNV